MFNEDEDFRNMLQEKMVTVLTGELDTRLPDTIKTLAKEAFDTMVGHLQHDMEQRIRNMLQHGL